MKNISDFYLHKLITNPKFNSKNPVNDANLLLPDFSIELDRCIQFYRITYPDQDISFTETYRSNALQKIHFNNGASKIKKNGMHHYGIAADCIFSINGKRTYKGDINLIRKIFRDNGLTILGMWDALHVQFVEVSAQQKLRDFVSKSISAFQRANFLEPTGEADHKTIAKAKEVFLI